MLHTQNENYSFFYKKGYQKKTTYYKTKWYVLDLYNTEVWVHKGRLTEEKILELKEKYNLEIKLN